VWVDASDLVFACPRCGSAVIERLYGPCSSCRRDLVAAYQGMGRAVDTERFEPKLHVVPNHVATKE
jgi:hypothetical protein